MFDERQYRVSADLAASAVPAGVLSVWPLVAGVVAALPVLHAFRLLPFAVLSPTFWLVTGGVAILGVGLGLLVAKGIMRERWGSFKLTLGEAGILREMKGSKPIAMGLQEIQTVTEFRGPCLRIESANAEILIPPGLENYEGLRDQLAGHFPIDRDAHELRRWIVQFGVGLFGAILVGLHFGVSQPWIIVATGLLIVFGWTSVVAMGVREARGVETKNERWQLLLALSLLWPVLKRTASVLGWLP